jgi:hypothetical protein
MYLLCLQYFGLKDWTPMTTTPHQNHDVTQAAAVFWLQT